MDLTRALGRRHVHEDVAAVRGEGERGDRLGFGEDHLRLRVELRRRRRRHDAVGGLRADAAEVDRDDVQLALRRYCDERRPRRVVETARSSARPVPARRTAPDPASHRKRFLSTPADTKWRPSGSHAHAVTAPPCRAYVRRHSAVRTRHSLIRWSFAQVSSESSSEGAQATNAREASWPRSSLSLGTEGCVTSHTTTTLSFDADASSAPDGENWTNHTSSVCPSSTWRVERGTSSRDAEKSSKRDPPARMAGEQRRWWPADAAAVGCVCQSIAWWRRVRSRSSGSSSDGGTCDCSCARRARRAAAGAVPAGARLELSGRSCRAGARSAPARSSPAAAPPPPAARPVRAWRRSASPAAAADAACPRLCRRRRGTRRRSRRRRPRPRRRSPPPPPPPPPRAAAAAAAASAASAACASGAIDRGGSGARRPAAGPRCTRGSAAGG